MGYSKTFEPSSIIVTTTDTLASSGEPGVAFHVNAGAYQRYLYVTLITDMSANFRTLWSFDYRATAPDWCQVELRINGTDVRTTSAQYSGAWVTATYYDLIQGLKIGDTLEIWARANTGATAEIRNFMLLGKVSPFYGSA